MESEILKYETQDKALHIADVMGCTISDIEVEQCPYCKKRSYFKKEPKEQGTVEVKVCGHCGDCINGFD
jgi:hypothetical protein